MLACKKRPEESYNSTVFASLVLLIVFVDAKVTHLMKCKLTDDGGMLFGRCTSNLQHLKMILLSSIFLQLWMIQNSDANTEDIDQNIVIEQKPNGLMKKLFKHNLVTNMTCSNDFSTEARKIGVQELTLLSVCSCL